MVKPGLHQARQHPSTGIEHARENRFRRTARRRAARDNNAFQAISAAQVEVLDGVRTEVVNDQNEGDAVMNEVNIPPGGSSSRTTLHPFSSPPYQRMNESNLGNDGPPFPNADNGVSHQRTCFEPMNFGGPSFRCPTCNANMWYDERVNASKHTANPKFNLCCKQGQISIADLKPSPAFLDSLLDPSGGRRSTKFREQVRLYNSIFQFTSTGGIVDNTVNQGAGPFVYKLGGTNHHKMGTMVPISGQRPKFAQLYMCESESELQHRLSCLGDSDNNYGLDPEIVEGLRDMLDNFNEVVKVFRHARDIHRAHEEVGYKICLLEERSRRDRNYSQPTANEIAAIVPGDVGQSDGGRDIIVSHMQEGLMRISELHPLYMALQYPLLFPYGEDSFHLNIPYQGANCTNSIKRQFVTMREYYCYLIQQRSPENSSLLRGGRLFQQFIVDAYSTIEETRLRYIRDNQKSMRAEMFREVRDSAVAGDAHASTIGTRIILPPSFVPGPRYLFEKYQDAVAICRVHGYPNLFITFTCDPRWPEILEALRPIRGQRPEDRPDIVSRVFRIKLKHLLNDLTKKQIFGKTKAVVYTVEFQKRGLPHVHILLWLDRQTPMTGEDIDKIVSAELPDKDIDPIGYAAVAKHMMHSPCGSAFPNAKCMKDGKCSKYFPKEFRQSTSFDQDGFPHYRRRQTSASAVIDGIELDNRFVVPHNVDLTIKYQAHINVEVCSQTRAVKYLFKYLSKGPDRIRAVVERENESGVNEVQNYLDCRYLSAYECCWRIFEFPLHHREPAVQRLLIHLRDEQNVYFSDEQSIESVLSRPGIERTMFTKWFETNKRCEGARTLLYADFPTKWTWKCKEKIWVPRKNRNSIGRIIYIHPSSGEVYYMRLMLNKIRGATCYEDLRTVDGVLYATFKEACYAIGLLGNDATWESAIDEAAVAATGQELRSLFVFILINSHVGNPKELFEKVWHLLAEDIKYRLRQSFGSRQYEIPDEYLKDQLLIMLEEQLTKHSTTLEEQNLPLPNRHAPPNLGERLFQEELEHDRIQLQRDHIVMFNNLNDDQRAIYTQIRQSVDAKAGGMYFVYGSRGTGKTYLWATLTSGLRSIGKIVLAVASSGIASLLLPGGRTAHSRFKIPLDISSASTCKITKNTQLARLIKEACLIIWDEAPMVHRNCIEALSKTLQDIMSDEGSDALSKAFGGKTVVFGGDFRQILPVIPSGSKSEIIDATITSSPLWADCKLLTLKTNMRLSKEGLTEEEREQMGSFAQWLLDIGNGSVPSIQPPDDQEGEIISVPSDLLLTTPGDPISSIISAVYPNFEDNFTGQKYLSERAIVTPYNEIVDSINEAVSCRIPGVEKRYISSDYISKESTSASDQAALYSAEYLNTLKFPGMANHELPLKVNSVVMLLCNISPAEGLCNGTRLLVTQLCPNVIEARIIAGSNIGHRVFLPRIIMSSKDKRWPFILCRRQFPLRLSYAMTINKSQGQTLEVVGLYLERPVFSHGQLYVALSRVTSYKGLKILILDHNGRTKGDTRNVVYREIYDTIGI